MQEEKEKGFFFCFYKKKDGRCKRKGKGFSPPRCRSLAKEKKKRQRNGAPLLFGFSSLISCNYIIYMLYYICNQGGT